MESPIKSKSDWLTVYQPAHVEGNIIEWRINLGNRSYLITEDEYEIRALYQIFEDETVLLRSGAKVTEWLNDKQIDLVY